MIIKIYTIEACKYCIMAKKLLLNANLQYEEIKLDNDYEKLENLIELTKQKQVPQIFINNQFIGGYEDLKEFINKKNI
ncbi:MAG: glutaredoxin domain-containing protein [Enterobacteriaceae bacterium]|nr:glutaredoxin domain-containing protein [Enterobacteriaceae bacterium]